MQKTLLFLLAASILPAQDSSSPTGIDLMAIDKKANPCNDFYQYACGTWMSTHPIPPDQATWSRFSELLDRNRDILRNILEKSAAASEGRSAVDQKIGDYYASCMDEAAINRKGLAPLQPELDRIAKLAGKDNIGAEVARLHNQGIPALFRFSSGQDAKDSTQVIAQIGQGGLSLPDRDFYLQSDAKSVETRDKFVKHVANMFVLLGHPADKAAAEASAVMRIETALAKASLDKVSLRDPNKRYHLMPVTDLASLTPDFAWQKYMDDVDVHVNKLNVSVPDFLRGVEKVVAETGLDDLKTYLSWHALHSSAPLLPDAFVNENFEFYEKTLRGAKQLQPRWKRCVTFTDAQLGEALGRKFVEQTFGQEGKQRTLEMVGEIEKEMAKDIESLPWMSAATKQQAMVKLHAVANKIGYPEKWRDYGSVKIVRGDALGNDSRASAYEFRRQLAKIGQPVDKQDWGMTPPTVNAYYNPPQNNINFPAGILQPPFYFKNGDVAANYGGIGAVVGHELTHGFDDQGRQFDGQGNLRDWWTAEDAAQFKERADCIVKEYGNFVATGDVKLNGKLTLGENAADNGGIRLAYMALMDSLDGHTGEKVNGYTPAQRFFLAFGQIWCQNQTEQAARLQALTNPHSLGRYRVNGVTQNMPEFQQAFGCHAGSVRHKNDGSRILFFWGLSLKVYNT